MKFFCLFYFLFTQSFATESHPYKAFPFLDQKTKSMSYVLSYSSSEEEYEISKTVYTHQDTKYFKHKINFETKWSEDLNISLGLQFSTFGTLEKFYDSSLNIRDQKINFSGWQGYDFSLLKRLPFSDSKSQYAVKLNTKGSFFRSKESTQAFPGYDISLIFFLSHKHENHFFTGELKSEIVGRQKTKLSLNNQEEIIDAYSILGAKIGYYFMNPTLDVHLSPYFYHTTDYNKKDPQFRRITDKGFIWGAEVTFIKSITPDTNLYLTHLRESHVFNIVDSSISSSVDYEIEKNETLLGVLWFF